MQFLWKVFGKVKEHLGLLFLLILSTLIGGSFTSTYWSFVDDGELIEVSQRMSSTLNLLSGGHLLQWLADPQMGRFRPFYWLYHWLTYTGFGINHGGHAAVQLLLILIIVAACYFTALKISGSKVAGLLAGFLFVANTLNQENWYRLGPQEVPLLFFLSLSVLFMVLYLKKETSSLRKPKYYLLSILFVFPAYFMKENSIAFLAFPLCLYLWSLMIKPEFSKKIKAKLFLFLVWNIILALMARYGAVANFKAGSYASEYVITFQNIKSNFLGYFYSIWITFEPLIIVAGIYLIIKTIGFFYSKKISSWGFLNFTIFIAFISFFVVQLPWQFEIPRYLLPAMYFFAIFMGVTLAKTIAELKSFKKAGTFLICVIWVLVLVVGAYNLVMMGRYINRIDALSNNFNKPLITDLASATGPDGTIILDTPPGTALELRQEIGLHLRLFFGRGDVKVVYFDGTKNIKSGDILLRAGEFKQVSADREFKTAQLEEPTRIDIQLENKLYYPPMQLLKNYLPKWLLNVVRRRESSFNPVLVSSQDNYFWEIYKINK